MNVNTGFKGTIVSIADIEVKGRGQGTVVRYRALFADAEGHVHAHTQHEVDVGDESPLQEPLRALVDALRRHTEEVHFTSPANPATVKQVISRGIAEAASEVPDSADEPGGEG